MTRFLKLYFLFLILTTSFLDAQIPPTDVFNQSETESIITDNAFVLFTDTFEIKPFSSNSDFAELPIGVAPNLILFAKGQKNKSGLKILSYNLNLDNNKNTSGLAINAGVSKLLPVNLYPKLYLTVTDSNQFQPLINSELPEKLRSIYKIPDNAIIDTTSATEFLYNNTAYNTVHTASNSSGTVIIFASNMLGGFGGYDLYITKKVDSIFSKPINLGSLVNTKFDELHPFLVNDTRFFYATNGSSAGHNFDLVTASLLNANMVKPEPLSLLNTDYNELAFVADAQLQCGAFASDQPNKSFDFNIYNFFRNPKDVAKRYQQLIKVANNQQVESPRCVTLDVSNSIDANGAAYTYSWSMGDGNTSIGLVATHCYKQAGKYTATLTASSNEFPSIVEQVAIIPVEINDHLTIAINALDTISQQESVEFVINKNWENEQAQIKSVTWKTDNKQYTTGTSTAIIFATKGWHKVEVLVELAINGKRKVIYNTKKVYIK